MHFLLKITLLTFLILNLAISQDWSSLFFYINASLVIICLYLILKMNGLKYLVLILLVLGLVLYYNLNSIIFYIVIGITITITFSIIFLPNFEKKVKLKKKLGTIGPIAISAYWINTTYQIKANKNIYISIISKENWRDSFLAEKKNYLTFIIKEDSSIAECHKGEFINFIIGNDVFCEISEEVIKIWENNKNETMDNQNTNYK